MANYSEILNNLHRNYEINKEIEKILKKTPTLKDDTDFFVALMNKDLIDDETISLFGDKVKSDRTIMKKLVNTWPLHGSFQFASADIQADKNFAFDAIKGYSDNIQFISDELKNDENFMFNLISSTYPNNIVLKYIPEKYRSNRDFVMLLLKKDYQSFSYVCDEFKNDKEVVWEALFGSGLWHAPMYAFEFASNNVKGDKEFVAKVLEQLKNFRDKKTIISFIKEQHKVAAAHLKGSKTGLVAEVKSDIKNHKKALQNLSSWDSDKIRREFKEFVNTKLKDFYSDSKIMLLALECEFSDNSLYGKKECVVAEKLDKKLLSDMNFLYDAMTKTNGYLYQFLPKEIKDNQDFLCDNYSRNIKEKDISDKFKSDQDFLLKMASRYGSYYNITSIVDDKLLADKAFMKKYLAIQGVALEKASDEIKKDKELVLIALSNFQNALCYADSTVLEDEEVIMKSIEIGGTHFLSKLSMEQVDNRDLIMKIAHGMKKSGNGFRDLLRAASFNLKKDKELALLCIAGDGWCIEHIDDSLKYDKDILTAAFNSGCHVYRSLDLQKIKSMYDAKELKKIAGDFIEYFK